MLLLQSAKKKTKCVYDFPSLTLATRASADVSELVFMQEWQSHECLKKLTALATKESTQTPPPVSTVSAGPRMVNASKSSLNAQTPEN